MKTVVFMRAMPDAGPLPAPMLLAERPWASRASRIVVQTGMDAPVEAGGPAVPPVYDRVMEIWADASVGDGIAADPLLAAHWELDIRSAQQVVGKEGNGPAPMGVTPGLCQLSFIQAIDGMPRAETERHWDEHIPLACEIHVGMNRYVQNRLSPADAEAAPWFGMAYLRFPDEAALRDGLFRSAEDVAVITADVAEFVADYATMLAIEHVVKG